MATILARERAVRFALGEAKKGVREHGTNTGPRVRAYQAKDGLKLPNDTGYAWCASFVNWCFWRAGRPLDELDRSASVGFLEANARKMGWLVDKPARGDIFCVKIDEGSWPDHTGLVVKANQDGTLRTVEGNTSSTSVDEGDGVYVKTRTRSFRDNSNFIRVPGRVAVPDPGPKTYKWQIEDTREVIQYLKRERAELHAGELEDDG